MTQENTAPDKGAFLDDGFGNVWNLCGPRCGLEIVRPGKVQCHVCESITTQYWPKPIPDRRFDWSAVRKDYDGAPDSSSRHMIGYGKTKQEAIENLLELEAQRDD